MKISVSMLVTSWFLLFFGCVQRDVPSADLREIIYPASIQRLSGQVLNIRANIYLEKITMDRLREVNKTRIYGGGGRISQEKSVVIKSFSVEVDNQTFSVPEKGLKDLTFPSIPDSLIFNNAGKDVEVSFSGGEGEFLYVCKLYLSENGFYKRVIDEVLNPNFKNVVLRFPTSATHALEKE